MEIEKGKSVMLVYSVMYKDSVYENWEMVALYEDGAEAHAEAAKRRKMAPNTEYRVLSHYLHLKEED